MTMPSRKSKRMANITPPELLEKIDELVDKGIVPSRSYLIRDAVRTHLKEFESK
jgi:metal-responsive CopG/Arc/MetJ family transcriptional regulator